MYGIDCGSRRQRFLQELQNSRPAWLSPVCTVPLHYYNDKCSVIVPRALFIMQPWLFRLLCSPDWTILAHFSPRLLRTHLNRTVSANEHYFASAVPTYKIIASCACARFCCSRCFSKYRSCLCCRRQNNKKTSYLFRYDAIFSRLLLTYVAVMCYNNYIKRVSDRFSI